MPLDKLLANLGGVPESVRTAVRNNGGGDANHIMSWQVMGPGGTGKPQGKVAEPTGCDLGEPEAMQAAFDAAETKGLD